MRGGDVCAHLWKCRKEHLRRGVVGVVVGGLSGVGFVCELVLVFGFVRACVQMCFKFFWRGEGGGVSEWD